MRKRFNDMELDLPETEQEYCITGQNGLLDTPKLSEPCPCVYIADNAADLLFCGVTTIRHELHQIPMLEVELGRIRPLVTILRKQNEVEHLNSDEYRRSNRCVTQPHDYSLGLEVDGTHERYLVVPLEYIRLIDADSISP